MQKQITNIMAFFLLLVCTQLKAQQVQIDRGVQVNGLWCFPLISDSSTYLYLPTAASLSFNEQQEPEFSFIRYVNQAEEAAPVANASILNNSGGGVLHFLVTYHTKPRQLEQAAEELKKRTRNNKVRITGPVLFKEGRYGLISTIINPETGQGEKKLFAVGSAPVLENSKIALSFSLDARNAKLLLESFKTRTPDLSLVFDLSFAGLTDAYDAQLIVDWDEVRRSMDLKGGLKVYVVSLEAEYAIQELMRRNAIKLVTAGNDAVSEALMTAAYQKIVSLLFDPAPPEQQEQAGSGAALTQAFSSLIGGGGGNSAAMVGFGVNAGFRWREMKSSGRSTISFNSRSLSERHHFITFNIGNFYDDFGKDDRFFRTVSLDDPSFQTRRVAVGIDGAIASEFGKMINSVTVTLKKEHDDGSETVKQLSLDKTSVHDSVYKFLSYGAVGDTSRTRWMDYQYQTSFHFVGGKTYHTPWTPSSVAFINIYVPFRRKAIELEGDTAILIANKVKRVVVQVEYPFFGEDQRTQLTIGPRDDLRTKKIELTLPLKDNTYRYTVTWLFEGGRTQSYTSKDDLGIIFIDNIPDKSN